MREREREIEGERECTLRNRDTTYSVARRGASDTKVLGQVIHVV
jgi:hypothetical protein